MAYDSYITIEFYTDTYNGVAISADKFNRLALRASDEIDKMTMNFVRLNGLSNLTTDAQEAVKLATCAMIDGLSRFDDLTGSTGVVTESESSNGYNYTLNVSSVKSVMKAAKDNSWAHLQRGGFYRGLYSGSGVLRSPT